MLGGQTLIKKGHRQNHQMTAVRKNPLRINNPKSPSMRSPLEMGSAELGATPTLTSPSNNGFTPTHRKHSLVVSGLEASSRPNSSLSEHPVSLEEEIEEENKLIPPEEKPSTKQTSPTTSISSPKSSSSNTLHNNALIRKNPLQNSSGQLPIPSTNAIKNSVSSLNKFTSLTPPVNKTHSLFPETDSQSRNNSRPSSATSTKGRKVINELVGLPNLSQQVSPVEPNIMSPTTAERELTTTRNLRSSFGVTRPPSAKLGISNTHIASTSTVSPAHHNQPTTFQTLSTTSNNLNITNDEKLPHVRPTSVKKSTFNNTETNSSNLHPSTNHTHEIPTQPAHQQPMRSSSLKSDTSSSTTPSTPDQTSLSYFKIKKVQRGKGVNDKKPLKVPILPKTRELKLENGGFLNDLTNKPEKDEEDLQIQTKNLHNNRNNHLIEESPVTPSPITPNSPELSFTPVIENIRKKPVKSDKEIAVIHDYSELTTPPQSTNKDRIPTPVLKIQDEEKLKDVPDQESPQASREKMRQLRLLEIFPNGLDSQNKKIKYQQHDDMDLSYQEVVSELKVLSSRVSMLRRNEKGRKNSFKNVYNFQNNSFAMDDINNDEIEKMEKRMRRLNYYRKIMTAGLAGWNEYKTERDSYVALRRSSLVEEQGFDEMSKEDEVVEIRRFDDEYRRFKQRLNPEISTKVAKAIEQVDPQSAAMSILENMVLSKSEKIKTEEDKELQKEKLTAEIIRWKSRWSPFHMSRTVPDLSSLESRSSVDAIDIADADEVFNVEDVSDEEKDEASAQSEDDESDEDSDFEIIILNDLQNEDDGFFLTSTMNENEETEEKMLNQVDPRKLLKAIVAASRKPVAKLLNKSNLNTTTNTANTVNNSLLPPIQPSPNQGLLSPTNDEGFVLKVNLRESRVMSQRNLSRYNGKEQDDAPQSKPALEFPRIDFDSPKPPSSPTDLIRKSREIVKEDMDLFHHAQQNQMEDDDDTPMVNSIDEQTTFMTDSIDQNGTIDWKKEAGMMKQRQRRSSVLMPVVEEEEDMVLMNEEEEKNNPSDEIIAEQLNFIEETPSSTDKQKFQFNQLLQHLNTEVEYSDKTKKKKKKKHKNRDHERSQSPRAREESDLIEEDPSMTITTDQQLSLQPNDGAKVIIELDELLGIGAHGKVYKGFIPNYVTNTKDPVAIKKLSVKAGRFSKKFIKLEVDILKQLYHPYLVQYLGCKYSSKLKEYSIVLEYVDGGTLEHHIKTVGPIEERTVSVIVSQVLMGLEYLHSKRIIHRDLKPANILISGKGVVKITDFGVSAQLLNIEAIRTSCVGTPHYSAPEVIMVKPYSFTADIWSLGCVVFELLFGKRPYDEFNQVAAMYHMVKDEKPPMPTPNNLSPVCLDFIDKCWTKDWKKRPTARELQTHPFVNNNEHLIQKFVKNMRQSLITPNLISQQTN